jgi:hypothetical protein
MDFIPFYSKFKEIAVKETRTITITSASDLGVPPGEYGLLENYCTDKNCDCRKVMINVIDAKSPHQILATIGYGWESEEFYTQWMHGDKETAKKITGAYLEPGCIQSKYSERFFELFTTIALTDEYVLRLKRHYRMFKGYDHKKPKKKKRSGVSSLNWSV